MHVTTNNIYMFESTEYQILVLYTDNMKKFMNYKKKQQVTLEFSLEIFLDVYIVMVNLYITYYTY